MAGSYFDALILPLICLTFYDEAVIRITLALMLLDFFEHQELVFR